MKTLLIFKFLIALAFLPLNTLTQDRKTGNDLWCMEFVDEFTGITFGGSGIIKQTTDGGVSWIDKTSNTPNTLKKSAIIIDDEIVVVGLNGTILKSNDIGETWTTKTSGIANDLYGVSFGGRFSEVGIAVGNNSSILRTTDQGETWNTILTVNDRQRSVNFKAVTMSSESKGILAGDNGTILLTNDGGLSWHRCSSDIPNVNFKFIISLSEDNSFVTGNNGTILETTDAGESWFALNTGVTNTIYRIRFADDQTAIAIGTEGTVLKSTDGGLSWVNEVSGTINNLNCLFVVNESIAYTGGNNEIILKTTDGGISWNEYIPGKLTKNTKMEYMTINCYPNPSNPVTKISYSLVQNANICVKIYDTAGREVTTLVNSFQQQGDYSVIFNGTGLSSGIYFCRLTVQNNNSITAKTMKIILVK